MFGKGYSPDEVAVVLLYPALGISEKALGEGPNTANYVGRTVRAASLAALPADPGFAAHKNTESLTNIGRNSRRAPPRFLPHAWGGSR